MTTQSHDRFSFLEFLTGGNPDEEAEPTPRRARASVSYGRRLLDRGDLDVMLLAMSASGAFFMGLLIRGQKIVEAFQISLFAAFMVPVIVYGVRVLGRHAPDAAASAAQFKSIVSPAPRLAGATPPPPTPPMNLNLSDEEITRQRLKRFFLAGKRVGSFSIRALTLDVVDEAGRVVRAKYMTDTAWRVYNKYVRQKWHIVKTANGKTWFAPEWDYGRAVAFALHDELEGIEETLPEILL